jgi:hypothetical protein
VTCHDGKGSRVIGERENCRPDETSRYVQSVSGFADYLKSLKRNPAQVVVAGIYGKPNRVVAVPDERFTSFTTPRLADVCGGGDTAVEGVGATPGIRMNALLAQFGGRASQSSICERELSWAMHDVGLVTHGAATRSRCLRGTLVDADTATDGLQPTCQVELVRAFGTTSAERTRVPACDATTSGPCFTIAADPACAGTESELAVNVGPHAEDETLTVECDVVR